MDPTELLEQILASINGLAEQKGEETTASLAKQMREQIKQLDAEWKAGRDAAVKQKDDAEAKYIELSAKMEKLGREMSDAQEKIWQFEENSRATRALVRYNERMKAMEDEYEMDEEDCAAVAADLNKLEVADKDGKDEIFAEYQAKIAKFWKHKSKAAIAKAKEEAQASVEAIVAEKLKELTKAGEIVPGTEQKVLENALDNAKASENGVSNNNETVSEKENSVVARWKKAFDPEKTIALSK